ncbi:MAG: SDR family NAD(P)-dependent oxidoreductase [Gemmatimonadaceae bacterium]
MPTLENKVALVTGAGRGIGQAIARKLAREGARVVVNDLDTEPCEATVAMLRECGHQAIACPGSVVEPGFAQRFVQTALDEYQGLDIIVNNAGFTWDSVIQKMSDDQFQAVMDVHVTGPFRILRAAADPIRTFAKAEAESAREVFRKVVNISSVVALGGNSGQVNYAAAKAAVIGMTRTLAKEWGRYRVNVNCVAFGFIQTRMTQAWDPSSEPVEVAGRQIRYGVQSAMIEALETQQIPLGRFGTVDEAANGVYLFCTPESDYISGQVITVGGGISF